MNNFDTKEFGENGESLVLCLHIGLGAGELTFFQAGGIQDRYEYVCAGNPINQATIAEPMAQNGETVVSPQAWEEIKNYAFGEEVDPAYHPGFMKLLKMNTKHVTYPTVRHAALEAIRVSRGNVNMLSHHYQQLRLLASKRYMPPHVYRQMVRGTMSYVCEMRTFSILFLQIDGVDVSTDEGIVLAQKFMVGIGEACDRNEGAVNKFVVDDKGLLFVLLFGQPPEVHTDDPLRAIMAGFHILQVLAGLDVRGRVGISTGCVYCGTIGSERRQEYTIMGNDVNQAARLMSAAEYGTIYTDIETSRVVKQDLRFTEVGALQVKGKDDAVKIHVMRPHPPSEFFYEEDKCIDVPFDPSVHVRFPWTCTSTLWGGTTPLTKIPEWGDLKQAQEYFTTSSNDKNLIAKGGTYILLGPSGMGKTVLCEWIVFQATNQSMVSVFGSQRWPCRPLLPVVETIHSVLRELERVDGAAGLKEAKKDKDAFAKYVATQCGDEDLQDMVKQVYKYLPYGCSRMAFDMEQESFNNDYAKGIDRVKDIAKKIGNYAVKLCAALIKLLTKKTRVIVVLRTALGTALRDQVDETYFWSIVDEMHAIAGTPESNNLLLVVVARSLKRNTEASGKVLPLQVGNKTEKTHPKIKPDKSVGHETGGACRGADYLVNTTANILVANEDNYALAA
jgi:class 3 adenylate cyclase